MKEYTAADLPGAFAQVVTDEIEGLLSHQQPDGSIVYEHLPLVYPQQAIMPLAFCYAGLGPDARYKNSPKLREAIVRLGDFLISKIDDQGRFHYDSHGYDVNNVDQRLMYAWTEALRMLREAGGDFPLERWGDKILRGCRTLYEERLRRLVGLRRFVARFTSTGTNHVVLYITTIYRAGQVLGAAELMDLVLPIGRAIAADVNPDGYWEEHSDMLRRGGPTPTYSYLSHGGIALMYEWTGEQVFADAIARSTRFHGNFCYPDARPIDLIDERVRGDHASFPMIWGLHGFSLTPQGRGAALRCFCEWLPALAQGHISVPECLARLCENFLYWHPGPVAPAPFETPDHRAALMLPAAVQRRGSWCIAASAIAALTPEDPVHKDNPFGLDRQKLLSAWHARTGLLIDGWQSKNQPENSTFFALCQGVDYYPIGGAVTEENGVLVCRATYKTFFAEAHVRVISDTKLQIEFQTDLAGNSGPVTAGFTLRRLAERLRTLGGNDALLAGDAFDLSGDALGGGFDYGPARITSPKDLHVLWPLEPYNSYSADHRCDPIRWQLRVAVSLTRERPTALIEIDVRF